jgi:Flp pilus assembly protein TadD
MIIAWNILGGSRFQIGMLDSAVDAFKKSISLMPCNVEAYNNMGVALMVNGAWMGSRMGCRVWELVRCIYI